MSFILFMFVLYSFFLTSRGLMAAAFPFCMMTPDCFSEKCATEETLSYDNNDNGLDFYSAFHKTRGHFTQRYRVTCSNCSCSSTSNHFLSEFSSAQSLM